MAEMTGAEALIRALEAHKVRHVFGLGGTSVVEILDQLVGHPSISYILGLHESSVVAMADGYAKASGETAFVNIHMMAGTANAMSALYTSYRDGTPLVITCGQQETEIAGRDTLTEAVDMVEATRQFTKWSWEPQRAERLPEALGRAFKVASSPPTGPVYLALPKDLLRHKVDMEIAGPDDYRVSPMVAPDPDEVKKVTEILLNASRPVMIVGGEVVRAGAVGELVRLSESLAMPVFSESIFSTHLGFPSNHPNYFGRLVAGHPLIREADAVLAIGCPLLLELHKPPSPVIPKGAKVIHINLNPLEIGKIYQANIGLVADSKSAARAIASQVANWTTTKENAGALERGEVLRRASEEARRAREEAIEADWNEIPIKPWRLVRGICQVLGENGILVDETVTNSGNIITYGDFEDPISYFSSSSGCLGWGLPGAIGAKLALPDRPVVACLGDGSFMFGVQALWTAAHYKIPVVAVVFNNRTYMAVKSFMYRLNGKAAHSLEFPGTDLGEPDVSYAGLAQAFGLYGERVERPEDIGPALDRGLSCGTAAVIDVVIDPKELGRRGMRLP